MSMATDTWTVVEATTTKGEPVVLVSDPEGDYFIVEQTRFFGDEPSLTAHKIGPGDVLKAGTVRFAAMDIPDN